MVLTQTECKIVYLHKYPHIDLLIVCHYKATWSQLVDDDVAITKDDFNMLLDLQEFIDVLEEMLHSNNALGIWEAIGTN